MIDRIDNNNYYNTYSNVGRKKVNTQDFSKALNGEKSSSQTAELVDENEKNGVKLDLSTAREHDNSTQLKEEFREKNGESLDTVSINNTYQQIKNILHSVVSFIKDTFKTIWEDDDTKANNPKTASQDFIPDELPVEPYGKDGTYSGQTVLDSKQSDIEKVLKSKDMNRLTAMITNNGKLKLAKNSQLLTTYNKQGKIVNLDGTEQERILHGDRNLMKL